MVQSDSMKSENGKVSILMGIYNCALTLEEAIDSILNQTYTNWELILCDDCSTDNTYEIAESYQKRYPDKIILLKNEKNSRLAFTLNHCLENATGEFVARMDGDDISVPERFEKQVAFLRSHPDIVLVGTAMQRFSDDGSLGAIAYCEEFPDKETPYRFGLIFNHATIMAYKSVYNALEGYAVLPRTVRGQDRDLWYRFLAANYKGANMSQPLYWVRENEAAIKRRNAKDRWIEFKTEIFGYKLLHYSIYRYYKPLVGLMKMLVPVGLVLKYRQRQAERQNNDQIID